MTTSIDYRAWLREELATRCQRNPAYSVRAMARDLDLSAGFLSQVLNRRKALSEERAYRIAESLRWVRPKRDLFTDMVRYEALSDPSLKDTLRARLERELGPQPFHRVETDQFALIARWYHLAILDLTSLEGFVPRTDWIARRLGLTLLEVDLALDRLLRLGLLEWKSGKLNKTNANVLVKDVPSTAIREFHGQLLAKATEALQKQDSTVRDITGTVMAIDPDKIPEAKERIRRFRHEMMAFLQTGRQRAVYHFAVQLFRLDKEITDARPPAD